MKNLSDIPELRQSILIILLLTVFTALFTPHDASALSSKFRNEFIYNRRANMLLQQEALVRDNKDIMPTEIELLIADALAYKNTFDERMYLLDMAKAMASVFSHQFGDDSFVLKIRSIQDMELAKEEAHQADVARWQGYMELRESFLMKEHLPQMEAAGLDAVVFPHWAHKLLFKCKACHESTFSPKIGSNDMTHEKFVAGMQCATCHNGQVVFSTEAGTDCARCHIEGGPGGVTPYAAINIEEVANAASKVGAVWMPERLTNGQLPLDHLGAIDWVKLGESGAIEPAGAIGSEGVGEVRDNVIIFSNSESTVEDVPFSHTTHSERVACATCHDALFTETLGDNQVKMESMGKGSHCGACHGKASFPLTDCTRCHSITPSEHPEGALTRSK